MSPFNMRYLNAENLDTIIDSCILIGNDVADRAGEEYDINQLDEFNEEAINNIIKGFRPGISGRYQFISSIIKLDLYKVYNIEEKYRTTLQRKHYEKTDDYRRKIELLKQANTYINSKTFYILNYLQSMHYEDKKEFRYDIKKKILLVPHGICQKDDNGNLSCYREIDIGIDAPSFKTEVLPVKDVNGCITKKVFIALPMNENQALEIENNINNDSLILLYTFKLDGTSNKRQYWYKDVKCYFKVKDLSIIIANRETNQIYYLKKFQNIK